MTLETFINAECEGSTSHVLGILFYVTDELENASIRIMSFQFLGLNYTDYLESSSVTAKVKALVCELLRK